MALVMALRSSMASHFDSMSVEGDHDPSIADGHKVLYDREVPFEIRNQTDPSESSLQEVGTLEAIRCKILVMGEENNPLTLRIELTSENDLFFHFNHNIDEHGFRQVQEQQKLMVDFPDYPNVLIRMFNMCIKEPQSHLAVFVIERQGLARLDFIQNMEYKFVELLSCNFVMSPEDIVRHHIAYRYNSMKSRLALVQARLQDLEGLIKVKNPSLLVQLNKPPASRSGTSSMGGHSMSTPSSSQRRS